MSFTSKVGFNEVEGTGMYETFVIIILALMRYEYENDPKYYWDRQHETFA